MGLMKQSPFYHSCYHWARWLYQPLKALRATIHRTFARRAARGTVEQYLRGGDFLRLLQVGCGPHRLDGWLNSDLLHNPRRDLFLDISELLPFPDASLDAIYASEVIEHVSRDVANAFFRAACRVLRLDGTLRITTPDLTEICRLYLGLHPDATIDQFGSVWRGGVYSPEAWVNGQFRGHGHQFIWSYDCLRDALQGAGFASIDRCAPRTTQSGLPQLQELERNYGRNLPQCCSLERLSSRLRNCATNHRIPTLPPARRRTNHFSFSPAS